MNLPWKAPPDVLDDAQVEFDDPVGEHLDLLALQVQVGERVLVAVQRVHSLEEEHEDVGVDVLALRPRKLRLHACVEGGVVGVGPAIRRQRRPVCERVALDLAHVGDLAARPRAPPLVERRAQRVVAGADLVPVHVVRVVDAEHGEAHRQAVGRVELDGAAHDFVRRHAHVVFLLC
ncbi:MAG: hypothetical protein M5R40_21075 [Anaerolineae bacterium]|nr:hypothetical protein [Anaerolineae bacterium]